MNEKSDQHPMKRLRFEVEWNGACSELVWGALVLSAIEECDASRLTRVVLVEPLTDFGMTPEVKGGPGSWIDRLWNRVAAWRLRRLRRSEYELAGQELSVHAIAYGKYHLDKWYDGDPDHIAIGPRTLVSLGERYLAARDGLPLPALPEINWP